MFANNAIDFDAPIMASNGTNAIFSKELVESAPMAIRPGRSSLLARGVDGSHGAANALA